MSRRVRGPFPSLAALPGLTADSPELDLLEQMDLVNQELARAGCNCARHHEGPEDKVGTEHDPYFGADLSELVSRSIPHEVERLTSEGVVVELVSVKLSTLVAEVDRYGEVCCWTYTED